MPIIIIMCILSVYAGANIYTNSGKSNTISKTELDRMFREMTGKSKREKRKILNNYTRRF